MPRGLPATSPRSPSAGRAHPHRAASELPEPRSSPDAYVASTTRASDSYQAEGAKAIAYEIVEQFGDALDWLIVPVGGGGTIASIWRGFEDMLQAGQATRLPHLAAVVPESYPALARAFADGIASQAEFGLLPIRDDVPTILNKLSHAHPPDGMEALDAVLRSGGTVVAVSDEEAIRGSLAVARSDGLYLEPSSGVVLPALERLGLPEGTRVVALACGNGFRETFVMQSAHALRRERTKISDLDRFLEENTT